MVLKLNQVIFLFLFFNNIIGSIIIFDLIIVQADLYIGNKMRSISLLILNLYKISDAITLLKSIWYKTEQDLIYQRFLANFLDFLFLTGSTVTQF